MSAESRQFVDTNVVVYMYDDREPPKQDRARSLIRELGRAGHLAVSIQVLQEVYMTVTRKLVPPLTAEGGLAVLSGLSGFPTHCPTAADVTAAVELSVASGISFWDAMLVRSASQLGCDVIWTEDLTPGQVIAGVEVRNPF